MSKTLVYYAHQCTSCDKSGVERHNRLIRRFITKDDYIKNYSIDDIFAIEEWTNDLPKKILNYNTSNELYEKELDSIYQK